MRSAEIVRGRPDLLAPLFLFLLTIISRLPFTSRFLYHLDSGNFALALDKYDISVHQPHPPGYFLYIMLGRLVHVFIEDANSVFVLISIVFSALTVVVIYWLGKEISDRRIGLIAAVFAVTSPNFWFHGEVALTYAAEAFFSAAIALVCWKICKGEHKLIWFSAVLLGLSGGVRQNTAVFLFPLWCYSVKGLPKRIIAAAVGVIGLVCMSWFVPMILMTGGLDTYIRAFEEMWSFIAGRASVFERGWESFRTFSSAVFNFTIYSIGSGVFLFGICVYSLIRNRRLRYLDSTKVSFYLSWILPALLFYLFILISSANPGYVLILMPAAFILMAVSALYIAEIIGQRLNRNILVILVSIVALVNSFFFLFSSYPVSVCEIREHDRNLSVMLDNIKTHDPTKTAIFAWPYFFYGFRHIMYYLPEFRAYQVDLSVSRTGEKRQIFSGIKRQTYLSREVSLPCHMDQFVSPVIAEDNGMAYEMEGIRKVRLPDTDLYIISGKTALLHLIYPGLKVNAYLSQPAPK